MTFVIKYVLCLKAKTVFMEAKLAHQQVSDVKLIDGDSWSAVNICIGGIMNRLTFEDTCFDGHILTTASLTFSERWSDHKSFVG